MHKLKVVPGDGLTTRGTEIYIDGVKVESATGLTLVAQTNSLWHATLEFNVTVEGFQIGSTGLDKTTRMYRRATPGTHQGPVPAEAQMNWQPIETAPRDGTWVLLTGGIDDSGEPACRCVTAFFEETYWSGGRWTYASWDSSWRSGYDNPTHWMPLPEPPKE